MWLQQWNDVFLPSWPSLLFKLIQMWCCALNMTIRTAAVTENDVILVTSSKSNNSTCFLWSAKSKWCLKLLTCTTSNGVGWWGNRRTHKTWIYFGNGVKCPQQCHYDSLFAAYVSSFITVCWICDFVFSPPASMQVHCAHMEERDVVWDASMEVGWRVCIIICSSALAFGNRDMGGRQKWGERDKVGGIMCKTELGRRRKEEEH